LPGDWAAVFREEKHDGAGIGAVELIVPAPQVQYAFHFTASEVVSTAPADVIACSDFMEMSIGA
jgi:hypothetical protein